MKKILLTLGIGAFLSSAIAQDITTGLEAYVSFDAGYAGIDAGNVQYNGINNGATAVDDRHGNPNAAMYFDGNDWIDFGNYSNYQFGYDSFTIACWVKGDGSTSSGGYVIGKRAFTSGLDHVYSITYNYNGGGQAFAYIRDDNSQAITSYPTVSCAADEWHHVALVIDRNANEAILYRDGTPYSAFALGNGFTTLDAIGDSYGNLVMGRSSNGDQYFKGWVDEVRIYRRALTQTDISALQDPEPIDLTSNLRIDLPFCDDTLVDQTGNYNMSLYFNGTYATTDRNGTADASRAFSTGTNSYIDIPHNLISNTDFTISVWYYNAGTALTQYPRLVDLSKQQNSVSDAIIIYPSISGGNVPLFGMWNASGTQQVSLYAQSGDASINEWTHLVVTKVGNMYSMYMNGTLSSSVSNSFVPANVNRIVSRLGRSAYGTPAELFGGMIDDFKVWQRGLNASEVAALYAENDACAECIVNIPDANFKAALVANNVINVNMDSEIQCDEASTYTGHVNVSSSGITDLTGLEAFTAITGVNVNFNNITSLDVSANVALEYLNCAFLNNSISTVDLSNNTALTWVDLRSTGITSIDLTDLSNLEFALLTNNNLTSIDVTQNPNLLELGLDGNSFSTVDLSQNPNLESFYCFGCNLGGSMDFSGNTSLYYLHLQSNQLTGLNVANGINSSFTFFHVSQNPLLTCIQVDDAAYSTTNWTNVDNTATFSENCALVGMDELDNTQFELYPNPTSGEINFSEPISGELMDLTGKVILGFRQARTIDISELVSGMYMIRTEGGSVHRVVRQ